MLQPIVKTKRGKTSTVRTIHVSSYSNVITLSAKLSEDLGLQAKDGIAIAIDNLITQNKAFLRPATLSDSELTAILRQHNARLKTLSFKSNLVKNILLHDFLYREDIRSVTFYVAKQPTIDNGKNYYEILFDNPIIHYKNETK